MFAMIVTQSRGSYRDIMLPNRNYVVRLARYQVRRSAARMANMQCPGCNRQTRKTQCFRTLTLS